MLLSHIVSKRYSREYENIATDALAFILDASEVARLAFVNLLRRADPSLPSLQFKAQEADDGGARPDLWGLADETPFVLVENKFWAGLTDNQPVSYLRMLVAGGAPSSVLAFVVPAEREETLWGELTRRLSDAEIGVSNAQVAQGLRFATTDLGPHLFLISWRAALAVIEAALVADPKAMADLHQLRALCDAADDDAIRPLSSEAMSDQDIPRLISSLTVIVQDAVERAIVIGAITIKGLNPTHYWHGTGRYFRFSPHRIAWIGVHFPLWRRHGIPLWLVFHPESNDERLAFESLRGWAITRNLPFSQDDSGRSCMGLPLPGGIEKEGVVAALTKLIAETSAVVPRHAATTNVEEANAQTSET